MIDGPVEPAKLIGFGYEAGGGADMKPACKRDELSTAALRAAARKATVMKRIGLWVASIGMVASAGLLTSEQGFADNDSHKGCSVQTLKGRYLFGGGTAILFPPAFGVAQQSVGTAAGFHIFNGDGTGQDYVKFAINGVVQPVPSPGALTYTLNADCTGTYSVAGGPNFAIFVSPDGEEMTAINTDPGIAGSYFPSRRAAKE